VVAALAMLVLVGQGLAQMISRSAADLAVIRALGATRAHAALAVSLPGWSRWRAAWSWPWPGR
jgi:hypothetical protein